MLSQLRKLPPLVDRTARPWLAALAAVSLGSSLMDSLSVAVVFGLFRLIVEPGLLNEVPFLLKLNGFVGPLQPTAFLALLCFALLTIFSAKAAIQIAAAWLRTRVEWHVRLPLSASLFEGFLQQPYVFHLQTRSSEAAFATITCTGHVALCVLAVMDIVSDAILFACVVATLFYLQPATTLGAVAAIALVGGVYLAFSHSKLVAWGRLTNAAGVRMWAVPTEALSGIKQIKALNAEHFFGDAYRAALANFSRAHRKSVFLTQMPKPIFEILVVVALIAPIILLLLQGLPATEAVPILALFGAAAFRLMPAILRMTQAAQSLQTNNASIETVSASRLSFSATVRQKDQAGKTPAGMELRHELRADGIGFSYPGTGGKVLENVSFIVTHGESIGIVGPSGAGKTTLVDILLGLLSPTTGSLRIDDIPVVADAGARASLFGYVPQESFLIDASIRSNVALGLNRSEIDDALVWRSLETALLADFVRSLPDGLDTAAGERGLRLSGGQRQRLAIARALYRNPQVLLLDEATSALDATTEAEIAGALQSLRGQKTVVIVAHRLSSVRNCSRLYLLDQGRIVDSGSFDDLLRRNSTFATMARHMDLRLDDTLAGSAPAAELKPA